MIRDFVGKVQRGIKKPPKVILERIYRELKAELERFYMPNKVKKFTWRQLIKETGHKSFNALWQDLASNPYPAYTGLPLESEVDELLPNHKDFILFRAQLAMEHKVELLGSGLINLGKKIDWHKDYKTGYGWEPDYFRSIDFLNRDRPSDVKFPWELSRLQWMIPLGQAYLITLDESYAMKAKMLLADWMEENPVAQSVNWVCTMEAAIRLFTFTWLFHAFKHSKAWQDKKFRKTFITNIFMHGDFTERYIEKAEVNGNHFTADCAALVMVGLFFNSGEVAQRWQETGWNYLVEELPRQVYADGVDFEASTAYHRLVAEFFLLPAMFRELVNLPVDEAYKERVISMGHYAAAYSRNDGSIPLWGDADDARALPFGSQAINDHHYLYALIGYQWNVPELINAFSGNDSELYWYHGINGLETIREKANTIKPSSNCFSEGGFYIMRNADDHVFIDCGRPGLADVGGHGHNDNLAFSAVLLGQEIISDCGAYIYTASFEERNAFRSTAYHNTPMIDGEEINRFIRPDWLWHFHYDAKPNVTNFTTQTDYDLFTGSHTGYEKLEQAVTPERNIILEHGSHSLYIADRFQGEGEHSIEIPYHLACQVKIIEQNADHIKLASADEEFIFSWSSNIEWAVNLEPTRISPTYGVVYPSTKIMLRSKTTTPCEIQVAIIPLKNYADDWQTTLSSRLT